MVRCPLRFIWPPGVASFAARSCVVRSRGSMQYEANAPMPRRPAVTSPDTTPFVHTRQQLSDDFRSLGLAPGDVVMVHASVRAIGEVAGGPDEIHLALKDVLTPSGTLMMYAACPRYADEVGRGNLMAEFDTSVGAHANWPESFFAQIVDGYLSVTRNVGDRVGNAQSFLMSARK